MPKIKRYGFIIIISFLLSLEPICFARSEQALELEPIVVTKKKVHLLNDYTLEPGDPFYDTAPEAAGLSPLDFQSRSPKDSIQTDYSLRASTFQGVLMLIDGRRINDPQTGHHNSDIPLTKEDIENVEVLAGAGSSLFGPDAIGGAINIRRRDPRENRMAIETGLGQHRSGWGLFSLSRNNDYGGLRISVDDRQSAGFREDTDYKKFTTSFSSVMNLPDTDLSLNFGYQDKEFGAFDFYTPGSDYLSKEWTRTYLLDTQFNIRKDGFNLIPSFLWRRHYDKFALDKTMVRSTYVNHHRTDLYTPSIYFQAEHALVGRYGLGLEYTEERINSTNLGSHSRGHESVFFDDNKDLTPDLSFGISGRFDDFDSFGPVYTGSAAARYKLRDFDSVRASVSRSMRVPSFTELYYSDPTTIGNADLHQEDALNYELGYDYGKKGGLAAGATIFYREDNNFIDWVKDNAAQVKWQARNITSADNYGVEGRLKFPLNRYLEYGALYAYTAKHINNVGYIYKYGQNYFKHLVENSFDFPLSIGLQRIAFVYKKKPDRRGWFVTDAYFSYNIKKNCTIFVSISNIFNVEYQEIVGIPQPRRWVESGVKLEW